jgi:two-component system, cell cycle response regulator
LPPEEVVEHSPLHSKPPPRPSLSDHWLDEATGVSNGEARTPLPGAVPVAARALVLLLTGTNAGQVFALEESETLLGRGRDVQVRIEDVAISRVHARIVKGEDGRFFVEDMGSTNGTFVNGTGPLEGSARAALRAGDRIQIGPNVVLRFSVIDQLEEKLARQLFEDSTRDPLTRVFNARYFAERLSSEVAFVERHGSHLGLISFDIDHFKQVNDTHGHAVGDLVLQAITADVARLVRVEDVLARVGGEEFMVLVRGIEHGNVVRLAERLRRSVERMRVPFPAGSASVTISVGVASLGKLLSSSDDTTPSSSSPEQRLLSLADARLGEAKGGGRNRVCGA